MSVSIEKIDLLMERAKVGYREARDVLEQYDGNVVEALIHLESNKQTTSYHEQKAKSNEPKANIFDNLKKGFAKMHKTRFVLSNNNRRLIDIPLTVATLLIVFCLPFSIMLLLLAVVTGNKLSIIKPNGHSVKVKEAIEFVETQQQKLNHITEDDNN